MDHQIELFLTIGITHLLSLMSPGPDFLIVTKNTLGNNYKIGVMTSFGVAVGNLVHIIYSILSITTLDKLAPGFSSYIKFFGAIYLGYIGIRSIVCVFCGHSKLTINNNYKHIGLKEAFSSGLFTCILNPKASLYFVSIFSILFRSNADLITVQILSVLMVILALIWFSFWAKIISINRIRIFYVGHKNKIEVAMGVFFLFVSFKILIG